MKSFKVSKSCLKFPFIEIQNFNCSNLVKWKYDQNKSFKFDIHEFFIWNHLLFQNIVSSWNCLNFKIWIVQTKSHDKMAKIKVVHIDELYNFYVYNIFILFNLKSFRVHNTRVKVLFFIWPNLTWSNLLKWDTKWPQMKKLWIPSLIISARSTIVT